MHNSSWPLNYVTGVIFSFSNDHSFETHCENDRFRTKKAVTPIHSILDLFYVSSFLKIAELKWVGMNEEITHIWKQFTTIIRVYVLNGKIFFEQLSYLVLGLVSSVIVKLLWNDLSFSNKLNGEQYFYLLILVGHFPVVNSESEHSFFHLAGEKQWVQISISNQFKGTVFF